MYFVYVLRNKRNRQLYIGYTNNLKRRFKQHNKKGDFELLYYESYQNEKDAWNRERKLKYYGSAWRGLKRRLNL